jgi:hypothetical protein
MEGDGGAKCDFGIFGIGVICFRLVVKFGTILVSFATKLRLISRFEYGIGG